MIRVALVQLNAGDDPDANLAVTLERLQEAASGGAHVALTPEVTNCVSLSRTHQGAVLRREADDPTLAALREAAAGHGMAILAGSLALLSGEPDGRFVNRSILIDAGGEIAGRYDKIHMFDVAISPEETYRESAGYRPGDRAVMARAAGASWGLTVCYDLRFAALYRRLARAGAQILTVPSAFSAETGPAHWEPLLRARAIETGAFVLAPAQTGIHKAGRGPSRRTHGHSLAVAPWGEVIADAGTEPGVAFADLDLGAVDAARRRIPALDHDRPFEGP